MDYTRIQHAVSYVENLFSTQADGHDVQHTMRVYRNAMLIAGDYPGCNLENIALAALLHDADDHKIFRTGNNANTRRFFAEHPIAPERIEQICRIINAVSFSRNRGKKPPDTESAIVQDADRLDAMGAVGIARTFAYGGSAGRGLNDSVQHFYDKLLLLRDELNTPKARELAERRHIFMEQFLEEYHREINS